MNAASTDGRDSEDVLKVLGRVADAFDNPSYASLHTMDKELKLFVVNVVKSRHLPTSFQSEESTCQDATYGSYDSSYDVPYDEDVELVELGNVSAWKHAASYPYASKRSPSQKQRSGSRKIHHRNEGMHDVTQMLLTSSPLDRLDRLARMELKKTGWVERLDKWTIVEMGLQGPGPLSPTPPKTPTKKAGIRARDSLERFASIKKVAPNGGAQAPHSPQRPEISGRQSPAGKVHGHDAPGRIERQADAIKTTSTLMRSPVHSQDFDFLLGDVSTQPDTDGSKLSRTNTARSICASRLSRAFLHPQASRAQTSGRLGQVVRNIVKKVLPPGTPTRGCTRSAKDDSPSTRTSQAEMTPRSDASAESGWTSGSASSWMEARTQGCMDYQTSNRWSGFWH